MRSKAIVVATAALAMLAFAACGSEGSSNGSEGSTKGDGGTQVAVTLDDYSIEPSSTSVPAGDITFNVENVGATEHEMVVIRTDVDVADIPVENHEANEEAPRAARGHRRWRRSWFDGWCRPGRSEGSQVAGSRFGSDRRSWPHGAPRGCRPQCSAQRQA